MICAAVLDTGIYRHRDFGNRIVAFYDCVNGMVKAYDDNSHGTHVAGIIAGDGSASLGRYKGIDNHAGIVAVKVLDQNGDGIIENVLKGLEWTEKNREKYNIRVINISFGASVGDNKEKIIALNKKLEMIWDRGIVIVTAAGNEGPGENSITMPGNTCKVITVGTYDDAYYTDINGVVHRNFSGRGPVIGCGIKPEIVAPGMKIISCTNEKDRYAVKTGTSMSTPYVTGAILKLLEKYPYMTPEDVKKRLRQRAIKLPLSIKHQGFGLLDINRFLEK